MKSGTGAGAAVTRDQLFRSMRVVMSVSGNYQVLVSVRKFEID